MSFKITVIERDDVGLAARTCDACECACFCFCPCACGCDCACDGCVSRAPALPSSTARGEPGAIRLSPFED